MFIHLTFVQIKPQKHFVGPLEGSWAVTPDAPIQLEEVEGLPPIPYWQLGSPLQKEEQWKGRNWPGILGSKHCKEASSFFLD